MRQKLSVVMLYEATAARWKPCLRHHYWTFEKALWVEKLHRLHTNPLGEEETKKNSWKKDYKLRSGSMTSKADEGFASVHSSVLQEGTRDGPPPLTIPSLIL